MVQAFLSSVKRSSKTTAGTSPGLQTVLCVLGAGLMRLGHRASIAAQLWKPLHEQIVLVERPCLPFFPHLIGEENNQHVVHYDERERCAGRDTEDDDRGDLSEGECDFVSLIQFGSH